MKKFCVPGWGYPASWWHDVCGKEKLSWSWGYFENERKGEPIENFLIVAHSFGLYMLPSHVLERAECIIWYGGFFERLPFAERTLRSFSRSPQLVMHTFIQRMFFPAGARVIPSEIQEERLFHDLSHIVNFDYDGFWRTNSFLLAKTTCVFGAKDRVLQDQSTCVKSKDFLILPCEGHMPDMKRGIWKQCVEQLTCGRKESKLLFHGHPLPMNP